MKILTQWTAEALHESWAAGVSHFFWYSLRDEPFRAGIPDSVTVQSGLYFRGETMAADEPKLVLYTFRFPFVAFARSRGLEFWGRTPDSAGGQVTIQFLREGRWRSAGTAAADRQGVFLGLIGSHYGAGKKGSVRALYRGQASVPFPMKRVGDFHHKPFG